MNRTRKLFLPALACLAFAAIIAGCTGSDGGSATARNIGVIDSVAPVDDLQMPFGNVTQLSAPRRTIVVVNYGGTDLTIGTIAGADALAAPFSIVDDACSDRIIAPAANCMVTVQFAPATVGAFNDSFDIPSDDPDTPSLTMSVSGTGVSSNVPDISVTDAAAPVNDQKIPFGGVALGSSLNKTVTITNIGTADLVIGSIASLNPLAPPFAITTDTCSNQTLPSSATCTVTITFTPETSNTVSDTFEIPSNDSDTLVINFSVSGKGIPFPPAATAALRTNGDTSGTDSKPAMAFNAAGHGLAVWVQSSGNSTRLLYSYFNGAAWSAQAELSAYGTNPDVTTDGTDFMIVYVSSYAYARHYSDMGGLGAAVRIDPSSGGYSNSSSPKVASNGAGGFAAAFTSYEYATSRSRAYSNIYSGGSWTAATAVDSAAGNAYETQIASNGTGYAITWFQYDNAAYSINANIYDAGAWSGATNIKSVSNYINAPQIASDGTGYAMTWSQYDGSAYSVYASVFAGSWAPAAILETGLNYAYNPRIASDGSSYAVAWYQYDGLAYSIYANIYSAGSWSTAAVIENATDYAYEPAIASNGSGYAVTWYQYDGSVYNIYANVYSAGSWATAASIETGSADAGTPKIFRKGTGYVAAWSQADPSGNSMLYVNTFSGVLWNASAQPVSSPLRGSSMHPKIAINQNGEALAVWQQFHNGQVGIYGSVNTAGVWGASFLISDPNLYSSEPAVASNGLDFMIVYTQDYAIYARPYCVPSGLGSSVFINQPFSSSGGPTIASNGSGYAAAWYRYDSSTGYNRVYASIFNGDFWGPALPISAATGYVPYAQISSNGEGYAAVWPQSNASGYYDVHAAVYSSGTWSSPELIETADGHADSAAIASDGSGYAATWHQYDGAGYSGTAHIYANIYSSGSWTAVTIVNGGHAGEAHYPAIASNGASYAISWLQYDASGVGIYANIYNAGTWGTESPAADFSSNWADGPKIASDGTGYAIVWNQYDQTYQSIFASKYSGSAWTAPELLETNDAAAQEASIVSNGAGYGAIWSQYDASDALVTDIWSKLGI